MCVGRSQAGFFQNSLGERGQRASNNRCGVQYLLSTEAYERQSVWYRATSQCLRQEQKRWFEWNLLSLSRTIHCLDQVEFHPMCSTRCNTDRCVHTQVSMLPPVKMESRHQVTWLSCQLNDDQTRIFAVVNTCRVLREVTLSCE